VSEELPDIIRPDWVTHPAVNAIATTRGGGEGFGSFNLATHVGDDAQQVDINRRALKEHAGLPSDPRWLEQVHGPLVVNADDCDPGTEADAAWSCTRGVVCAVLTADCLPVLFADRNGFAVAAAHAGWRGLCSGILDLTAQRFFELDVPPDDIFVWLGPAIGPAAYEVDENVRDAFLEREPDCAGSFIQTSPGHWQFDLYEAARSVLAAQGVTRISGGDFCTYRDKRFNSYRRDPECGRQATMIWLSA